MKALITLLLSVALFVNAAESVGIEEALQDVRPYLEKNVPDIQNYKLVLAENKYIRGNKYIGANSWFFTFKTKQSVELLSDMPQQVGGEIFVLYNADSKEFKVTYGE